MGFLKKCYISRQLVLRIEWIETVLNDNACIPKHAVIDCSRKHLIVIKGPLCAIAGKDVI